MARKDISNQISGIWECQKKLVEFCCSVEQGHIKKKTGVMRQGRKKVEVGTLFLFNDKTNVVADKVLSYFECLSSKFEVLAHISGLL